MIREQGTDLDFSSDPFKIVGVNYVSLYVKDLEAVIEFYSKILGPPTYEEKNTYGFKMGTTWLTIFPSRYGTSTESNPCNAEFAIQVAAPEAVDKLHERFLKAGAKEYCAPEDTTMYEPMRFSCVDDPFGVRIDIYCPVQE